MYHAENFEFKFFLIEKAPYDPKSKSKRGKPFTFAIKGRPVSFEPLGRLMFLIYESMAGSLLVFRQFFNSEALQRDSATIVDLKWMATFL